MNYRLDVARIRSDAARARAEAAREVLELRAARDREIRELKAEDPSIGLDALAANVGCSRHTVYEVLNPDRREAYNRRRREHWQARSRSLVEGTSCERSDGSHTAEPPALAEVTRLHRIEPSGSSTSALPVGA